MSMSMSRVPSRVWSGPAWVESVVGGWEVDGRSAIFVLFVTVDEGE